MNVCPRVRLSSFRLSQENCFNTLALYGSMKHGKKLLLGSFGRVVWMLTPLDSIGPQFPSQALLIAGASRKIRRLPVASKYLLDGDNAMEKS